MVLNNIGQKTVIEYTWTKIIHQKKLITKIWLSTQNTSKKIKLKNFRKMRFLSTKWEPVTLRSKNTDMYENLDITLILYYTEKH